MIIYCSHCWNQNQAGDKVCERCGVSLKDTDSLDFVAKLISALDHPEPATPARAASILGKLREKRAVGPLIKLAKDSTDPYILESAVAALGEIGSPEAADILSEKLHDSYLIVKLAAIKSLGQIGGTKAKLALQKASSDENRRIAEAAKESLEASPK